MKYHVTILFFSIILFNAACRKSEYEPQSGGTTLSQLIYNDFNHFSGGSDDMATAYYNYNTDNQLTSIVTVSSVQTDSTVFIYDVQGKLTDCVESSSKEGRIADYQFIHDAQGRIVRKTGIPSLPNLQINDHTYTYDDQNRVIADSAHNLSSAQVAIVTVYEYENDDVTKTYFYINQNDSLVLDEVLSISYDTRMNPYYQNRSVLFFSIDAPNALSKNNQTLYSNASNPVLTFSYYSNGLPKTITAKSPPDQDYSTTDFIYKK